MNADKNMEPQFCNILSLFFKIKPCLKAAQIFNIF